MHKKTKALLAVYVDDLLRTAPSSHEKELWKALEARINFDDEPSELAKFLGAHHDLQTETLVMSSDADLAGDLESSKSTSSLWLELRSADDKRCWPLVWKSKRQGFTASSTCEAEMISLATALKSEVLLMLELLEQALCRPVRLRCLEYNTQCLQAAETGYSAALRHLTGTERISVGVVHETFSDKDRHELVYQETSSHKGDMFTKRLDPSAFERALTLINPVHPDGSSFKVA